MSDEELIKRLREWDGIPAIRSAADRIEALVKACDRRRRMHKSVVRRMCEQKARAERLEAELKSVLDRESAAYTRHDAKVERLEAALKTARAYVENMARTWEHAQQDLAHIDTALKGADHE